MLRNLLANSRLGRRKSGSRRLRNLTGRNQSLCPVPPPVRTSICTSTVTLMPTSPHEASSSIPDQWDRLSSRRRLVCVIGNQRQSLHRRRRERVLVYGRGLEGLTFLTRSRWSHHG